MDKSITWVNDFVEYMYVELRKGKETPRPDWLHVWRSCVEDARSQYLLLERVVVVVVVFSAIVADVESIEEAQVNDEDLLRGMAGNTTLAVVLTVAIRLDIDSSYFRPYVMRMDLTRSPIKEVLSMVMDGEIAG